jgi:hypothetical protein
MNETTMFVVWNTKLAGWLSRTGNYTSELSAARTLPWSEARELCAAQHRLQEWGGEYGLLPVSVAALREVSR